MTALDTALFLWLNLGVATPHWLVGLARAASEQLPDALAAACAVGAWLGPPAWRAQAPRVLLSVALAALAATLLKHGIYRPRPFMQGLGTAWQAHAPTSSFPSAHTAVAMAMAAAAACAPMRWRWRALLLAAVVTVGWSRVALGMHFPTDVLAGAGLGALCAGAVQRVPLPAAQRWRRWLGR